MQENLLEAPVENRINPEVARLLAKLKIQDRNGWLTITDGSSDSLGDAELIAALKESLCAS